MKLPLVIALAVLLSPWSAGSARAAPQRFDILEYRVEGNEVLPVTAVEKAVYPFLGEQRTLDDVEGARAALEKAYRDAGYLTVIVRIPEQEIRDDVVRLSVTSGRLARLKVTGSRYYEQGRIRERAAALQEGKPMSFPAIQQDLGELNRNEALRVVPVLRPGPNFGTTEVDLAVTDKPPYGFNVGLNNYYSPNTTELRLSGNARYDNLWQREHSVSLGFVTSPQNTSEVKSFTAAYAAPLDGNRGTLAAYYVVSDSSVAVVGDQTVLGKGDIFGLRWSKPLPALGNLYSAVTLGADYKDFRQNFGAPGQPPIEQPVRYVPGTLSWAGSFAGARSQNTLSSSIVFGIRALSDSDAVFANRRYNARSGFLIGKLEMSRTQRLNDWLAAYAQVDGQLADGPLVVNEQFLAGGASLTSVRGYLEAEKAGDDGAHGTFELRAGLPAARVWARLDELQLLSFFDWAAVRTQDPLPGQERSSSLASAGVGLRARAFDGLRLRLDFAFPFDTTQYTEAGKPRLQFSALYQY